MTESNSIIAYILEDLLNELPIENQVNQVIKSQTSEDMDKDNDRQPIHNSTNTHKITINHKNINNVENGSDTCDDESLSSSSVEGQSPETEENFTRMTMTEKLMTVFLGIILPAVDVFTDILFAIKMFKNKHKYYGLCALSPIMISNIWSSFHWRRVEKSTKGKSKVMAIFAFIFQLWPQYRAMRLLYFDRKLTLDLSPVSRKNYVRKFQEEKDIYSKDLCFLEPFLESIPQLMILFSILMNSLAAFVAKSHNFHNRYSSSFHHYFWIQYDQTDHNSEYCLIIGCNTFEKFKTWFTLAVSALSAAYGAAKFFKEGPMRLFPTETSIFSGGFLILCVNILLAAVTKAAILGYVFACTRENPEDTFRTTHGVICWMLFYLVPQLILAILAITVAIPKQSFNLIKKYPVIILAPVLTFWTFGPVNSPYDTNIVIKSKKIGISFFYTWLNVFITIFVSYVGGELFFAYVITPYDIHQWGNIYESSGYIGWLVWLYGVWFIPIFVLGPIWMFQIMEKRGRNQDSCIMYGCRIIKDINVKRTYLTYDLNTNESFDIVHNIDYNVNDNSCIDDGHCQCPHLPDCPKKQDLP